MAFLFPQRSSYPRVAMDPLAEVTVPRRRQPKKKKVEEKVKEEIPTEQGSKEVVRLLQARLERLETARESDRHSATSLSVEDARSRLQLVLGLVQEQGVLSSSSSETPPKTASESRPKATRQSGGRRITKWRL
jgi:hypothetical protein